MLIGELKNFIAQCSDVLHSHKSRSHIKVCSLKPWETWGEWLDHENEGTGLDTMLMGDHLLGGSNHIRTVLCTFELEASLYLILRCWDRASQVALVAKNPLVNAGDVRDLGSIPGSGRSSKRERQPNPVFLPGESHGQRSLAGYNPWGHKELDMTEAT